MKRSCVIASGAEEKIVIQHGYTQIKRMHTDVQAKLVENCYSTQMNTD